MAKNNNKSATPAENAKNAVTNAAKADPIGAKLKQLERDYNRLLEDVSNAQLYGSTDDVITASAKLNKVAKEYEAAGGTNKDMLNEAKKTPSVENPGYVQTGTLIKDNDKIDAAISKYKSANGTLDGLLNDLRALNLSDDSILSTLRSKGLYDDTNNTKLRQWVDEKEGKKSEAYASDTPYHKTETAAESSTAPQQKTQALQEEIKTSTPVTDTSSIKFAEPKEQKTEVETKTEEVEKPNNPPEPEKPTETDSNVDKDQRGNFWNKFKAGAFRAYPMLQAVGDAISKNARMTADRAAILTGGQRDPEAYNTVNPEDYQTDDYKVRQAYLDAQAGNMDSLRTLVLGGKVTLEDAAAALNMTPEELEQKWGRTVRKEEAETQQAELNVEEVKQDIDVKTSDMISALRQEKTQLQNLKRSLAGNDFGAFNDAVQAYKNLYGGVVNAGTALTESAETNWGTNAGVDIPKVLEVGGKYGNASGTSSTGTTSTDKLLFDQLNNISEQALNQMYTQNDANRALQEQIQSAIDEIDADIAYWNSIRSQTGFSKKTALNYGGATKNEE